MGCSNKKHHDVVRVKTEFTPPHISQNLRRSLHVRLNILDAQNRGLTTISLNLLLRIAQIYDRLINEGKYLLIIKKHLMRWMRTRILSNFLPSLKQIPIFDTATNCYCPWTTLQFQIGKVEQKYCLLIERLFNLPKIEILALSDESIASFLISIDERCFNWLTPVERKRFSLYYQAHHEWPLDTPPYPQ